MVGLQYDVKAKNDKICCVEMAAWAKVYHAKPDGRKPSQKIALDNTARITASRKC